MNIITRLSLYLILLSQPNLLLAGINPAISNGGLSKEVCDIRTGDDDSDTPIMASLRDRLNRFNNGEACLYGIYFLEPTTIKLKAPLFIENIQSPLKQNKGMVGTYISGLAEDQSSLGIVIDGSQLKLADNECVIMIRGGLESFQQIHDIEIITPEKGKAICDENGNNLRRQIIPWPSMRDCNQKTKAKDCDFKNTTVIVKKAYQAINFNLISEAYIKPHFIQPPTASEDPESIPEETVEPEKTIPDESEMLDEAADDTKDAIPEETLTETIPSTQTDNNAMITTDNELNESSQAPGCSVNPDANINIWIFTSFCLFVLLSRRFIWPK